MKGTEFTYDHAQAKLFCRDRHVADVTHSTDTGLHTVTAAITEISHIPRQSNGHLGLAILDFTSKCREDPAARSALGLD